MHILTIMHNIIMNNYNFIDFPNYNAQRSLYAIILPVKAVRNTAL